jgi:aldose 1-epimerase
MKPTIWNAVKSALIPLFLAGCQRSVSHKAFGKLPDGREVQLYTLTNKSGASVQIMNYGGIVTSIKVPDAKGVLGDVVLGYDDLDGYLKSSPYFGAIVGRYANRIAGGKFKLDGKEYQLAKNNGANALHGGLKGFDKVLWTAEEKKGPAGPALLLTYVSPDSEEGYPGTLTVQALHTWSEANELSIDFSATTDKPTVVNLTHHSYFNLAGAGDVHGYEMQIFADAFTPIDAGLIPTGEIRPVKGTAFDFNAPGRILARIADPDPQLVRAKGYDHNWVLRKQPGAFALAARVRDPQSGRVLEVSTTDPGLQFYSGNFLDGTLHGKKGVAYTMRAGLCLEPQHYPDSPNHPAFPSTVLRPGETYKHSLSYRFTN